MGIRNRQPLTSVQAAKKHLAAAELQLKFLESGIASLSREASLFESSGVPELVARAARLRHAIAINESALPYQQCEVERRRQVLASLNSFAKEIA